jgi:GNAT superfamily N-acetyltransferase
MASAAELASARGFARMHLTVQTENHRAIRFYEKLGWDRVADGDAWEGAMAMSIADSMAPSRDL